MRYFEEEYLLTGTIQLGMCLGAAGCQALSRLVWEEITCARQKMSKTALCSEFFSLVLPGIKIKTLQNIQPYYLKLCSPFFIMTGTLETEAIHRRVVRTFILSLLFQMSWTRINSLHAALRNQLVSRDPSSCRQLMSSTLTSCRSVRAGLGPSWGWLDRLQCYATVGDTGWVLYGARVESLEMGSLFTKDLWLGRLLSNTEKVTGVMKQTFISHCSRT